METPYDQRQPETVRRAGEKVIDQDQGRDSMLRAAGGLLPARSSSWCSTVPGGTRAPVANVALLGPIGAEHVRRGQVVAAAAAPVLGAIDFQPGDAAQVNLIGAVGDA